MRTSYPKGPKQSDFVVPGQKVDQEHSNEIRNEICNPDPCDRVRDARRNRDAREDCYYFYYAGN